MFNIFKGIKETMDDITEEFNGAKDQLKNDVIKAFKDDKNLNFVGDALEKVDKTITTIKNPNNSMGDTLRLTDDEVIIGDHIKVGRVAYSHHGIYIGNNNVIHYSDGIIKESSIEEFKKDGTVIKVLSGKNYDNLEIVNRARRRMFENDYHIVFNNCEHFARWCRSGN